MPCKISMSPCPIGTSAVSCTASYLQFTYFGIRFPPSNSAVRRRRLACGVCINFCLSSASCGCGFCFKETRCVQSSGSKWDSTYHSIFSAMLPTEQAEFKHCHKQTFVKQPPVRRGKSGEEPWSSAPLHYATARRFVGNASPSLSCLWRPSFGF
jgi:hypothetical protein